MLRKIILIGGHINSGKNQFAKFLQEACGDDESNSNKKIVRQDLFAYSLKHWASNDFIKLSDLLNKISGEIMSQLPNKGCEHCVDRVHPIVEKLRFGYDNWFEYKTDITRTLLQIYGTEIMRHRVKDNYWAEDTKSRIKADQKSDIVIITDFRFPNEVETMQDDDWELYTIRMDRHGTDTNQQIAEHTSETSLDDYTSWSYIIQNDKETSLQQLKNMAKMVAEDILKSHERNLPWPVWCNMMNFSLKGETNASI